MTDSSVNPGALVKLDNDPAAAADALHQAAELNREDPVRKGSMLHFGGAGQLVMTGDMHGNVRNFEKLRRYCALESSPARYVILHELLHAEPAGPREPDDSIDLLLRAVRWKCDYPDNVFFLQSNHELSQYCRHEIVKGGRSVLADFEEGVRRRFGGGAEQVYEGVLDYIESLPLAARTANGLMLSHSLPSSPLLGGFDTSVFERLPGPEDLSPGGAAHALVWGRFQPPEAIEVFARRLGVDAFVVGHMPQEFGHSVVGRMLILASDHDHGVFLPIDLGRRYTMDELVGSLRKFVGVP